MWRSARALVTGLVLLTVFLASCSSGNLAKPNRTASPAPAGIRAPTAFVAEAKNGGQVELTWAPAADEAVTGYTIYRDGSLLKFVSPTLSGYIDITAQPERTYSYEIESVTSAGRSSRVQSGEVSTPAPPSVALAQVTGDYRLAGKVVDYRNIHDTRVGEPWRGSWRFFPVCTDWKACNVTSSGEGGKEATLKRSGASYSGVVQVPNGGTCESDPVDETDTIKFKVTRAKFIKGIWTATRIRGTIRTDARSRVCSDSYVTVEFNGMWERA